MGMHPDILKCLGCSNSRLVTIDETLQEVVYAADVVLEPGEQLRHDHKVQE